MIEADFSKGLQKPQTGLRDEAEALAQEIENKGRWRRSPEEKRFLEAWKKHKTAPTAEEARKVSKLRQLKAQMHPRDREAFERAQEKYKPNIDHDLFVASMHVPPRGGEVQPIGGDSSAESTDLEAAPGDAD